MTAADAPAHAPADHVRRDADAAPDYWDGVRSGRLLLPRCQQCARFWHPRVDRCPGCRGPLAYVQVAPSGTVHSFTVVHRAFVSEFAGTEPYVVANVTVDGTGDEADAGAGDGAGAGDSAGAGIGAGGVRLLGRVTGIEPERVGIGTRVRAEFVDDADFGPATVWRIT